MDPISNILCTIRNGISAKKTYVSLPYGKIGWAICHVLYVYGYIHGMGIQLFGKHKRIVVVLLPQNEYTSYTKFPKFYFQSLLVQYIQYSKTANLVY